MIVFQKQYVLFVLGCITFAFVMGSQKIASEQKDFAAFTKLIIELDTIYSKTNVHEITNNNVQFGEQFVTVPKARRIERQDKERKFGRGASAEINAKL